jgi:hypothetical protein
MRELFRNEYWVATATEGEPWVRITRTTVPYGRIDDLVHSNEVVAAALEHAGHRRLLLDVRHGPTGRNDAPFEEATQHWRQSLGRIFNKRAVLVRSAVGLLQVNRLNRGTDNVLITQDERAARSFLSTP